tara:strand:- start:1995 stop:2126 length:132 start_codon:yes stop_codon:yes gene_type:complete
LTRKSGKEATGPVENRPAAFLTDIFSELKKTGFLEKVMFLSHL